LRVIFFGRRPCVSSFVLYPTVGIWNEIWKESMIVFFALGVFCCGLRSVSDSCSGVFWVFVSVMTLIGWGIQ
jgi:hypothetical protein